MVLIFLDQLTKLIPDGTRVIDLRGVVGSSRHLGVRVSFFYFSGRQNLPVLDARRIVPVGSRVGGDGISRLLSPFGE